MCFLFKHLGPSPPQDVNSAALKLAVGLNLRSGLDFNRPPPWGDILAKKWGKGEFVCTAKRDRVPPPPTVCVKAEDQPPNGGADHTASSLPEPLSVDLPAPGRRNPCMAARQPRILSPFFSIQASAWALQACSVDCVFWRMFFFFNWLPNFKTCDGPQIGPPRIWHKPHTPPVCDFSSCCWCDSHSAPPSSSSPPACPPV